MSKLQYQQYLFSKKWQLRRYFVMKRSNKRCEQCSATRDLHVHHKTYANVGNEPLKDLLMLCADCHQAEHPHRELVMRLA